MATNKDNLIFEKTSFLHGVNSPFIKELYLKYLNNPKSIPESWIEFFDGLVLEFDQVHRLSHFFLSLVRHSLVSGHG